MKKKFSILGLVFVLILSLIGCSTNQQSSGSNDGGSENSKTYFINPKSIGPAYWAAAEKGAKQAGEDLGAEVIFNAPTEADSSKQINMIQDMLTRQVTGIGVAPNDAKAVAPIFKKAIDQGAQVVTWDSDAPETDRQFYLAPTTDKVLGEELAKIIAEQMNGKGQLAFMVAGLGAQNQIAKADAATAYLEKNHPEIEIVTTVASNDDQQKSFENAQNLLKAYPDLAGIIGFAGGEPPAAAEAVEQAVKAGSLKEGQVKITGIAVPSLVKKYIQSKTLEKIMIWDPGKLGYATVYVLDQLAQGKEITDGMEIPNVGKIIVDGQNIFIGTIEITEENVDSFEF
jgi:rhamnose transport system substrate-binding protein